MTLEQLANDLYANHREAEALELRRALKDAERYRFIRHYQVSVLDVDSDGKCVWVVNAESFKDLDWVIDTAIDAAKESQ